ncbi:MAG: phosphonoacetaldehyde hydrolase, partial [Desulfobacterales bacterium]|nr:phosphonoacetaldehyde hydrolase [Desulfobacterales bacterium]
MEIYVKNKPYTGKVKAVVMDWAGTAVDYGSIGPVAVFIEVFRLFGVSVSVTETRQFMGLMKKDHIRGMCGLPSVQNSWVREHGRLPDEKDIDAMYRETERLMIAAIAKHSDPIPGLLETVDQLRRDEIKIGTSTGYTSPMMKVLVPLAAQKGYQPDNVVCASDVPAGRPYPWMCFKNAIDLQVYPMEAMVKIGDTISDIEEGLNAGIWTVGVAQTGNELGLSQHEVENLPGKKLGEKLSDIEQKFKDSGADFVIHGIWDLSTV